MKRIFLIILIVIVLGSLFFVIKQQTLSQAIYDFDYEESKERINLKDLFKLLYESLLNTNKDYENDVMGALTFLIIAIGWILTSEKSRGFFQKNNYAYYTSLGTMAVIWAIHAFSSLRLYFLSQSKIILLNKIDYVDHIFYATHEIKIIYLFLNLIMNTSLFVALFVMIFSLRKQ